MTDTTEFNIVPGDRFSVINPITRDVPPDNRWVKVLEVVQYNSGTKSAPDIITVPVGFDTDFASIPRALWSILPPKSGRYKAAALIHDRIYRTHERTRKEADLIFRQAMKNLGVGWRRRNLMYFAVRAGGWRAWNRGTRRIRAEQEQDV